ncbi:DUF2318 domain-containing protein [Anaerocolumna xylanovorans]|uniref:Predicted membrane protein n=1 Tax=Anaerocolumna xylanovorans DSM 12503 TaxID=1121345 RepID=A0A1M7YFF6_9FIRM|nr:DUF2318 domain-containing protein [Anaerocolumna xylanovorans]SHO51374.1 Predicted membrane protein [Anaerocolumna xylanovorans DSM 12503]
MVQKPQPQNNKNSSRKHIPKRKKWVIPAAISSAILVIIIVVVALATRNSGTGNTAQDLVIPVSEISSTAKFYPVTVDGTKMEVVAVKAPDGTIRTAFNTCEVCYDSGRGYYKQEGDVLVCQNCGNRFSMDRVEVEAGSCNPWPIFDKDKTVTEESITISKDFLKESRQIFADWKTEY